VTGRSIALVKNFGAGVNPHQEKKKGGGGTKDWCVWCPPLSPTSPQNLGTYERGTAPPSKKKEGSVRCGGESNRQCLGWAARHAVKKKKLRFGGPKEQPIGKFTEIGTKATPNSVLQKSRFPSGAGWVDLSQGRGGTDVFGGNREVGGIAQQL